MQHRQGGSEPDDYDRGVPVRYGAVRTRARVRPNKALHPTGTWACTGLRPAPVQVARG
jgi:hypothetical protein